ncbi:MAG: GrpE protein [Frankiales bacterium]|nr:GrpE protein [Frankiales bacterium]
MTAPDQGPGPQEPVVVHDRRRLDPDTGEVRAAAADPLQAEVVDEAVPEGTLEDAAAELTADLQRVTAEYANYRKRVDRDRVAVVDMATAGLLSGLLPVLDDIDRARQHGDLTGAFAAVADRLEQVTSKLGLERFGEAGEPFDPSVHEALMQAEPDPAQTVATCAAVLQPGYRLSGGRVLRPARVSVAEAGATAPADTATDQ